MMGTEQAIMLAVLGVVAGVCGCWWFTGSYYHTEPGEREKELWRRIGELEAILEVPPLFWQVWAYYIHELSHNENDNKPYGKHAAGNQTSACEAPDDIPRPRDGRD